MTGRGTGPYGRLLRLHRHTLVRGFRLDGIVLAAALVYVFGARTSLDLTVSRGVFLLAGLTFAALLHGEIWKRSGAPLSFYLRLPLRRGPALLLFYGATTLPTLLLLAAAFLILRGVLPETHRPPPPVLRERFLQALFGILFLRSLTVNLMAAVRIHAALVAAYYVVLVGILVYLLWLREALLPAVEVTPAHLGGLFLVATYALSLFAVRRAGI